MMKLSSALKFGFLTGAAYSGLHSSLAWYEVYRLSEEGDTHLINSTLYAMGSSLLTRFLYSVFASFADVERMVEQKRQMQMEQQAIEEKKQIKTKVTPVHVSSRLFASSENSVKNPTPTKTWKKTGRRR